MGVGSSFANAVDAINDAKLNKEAVKDSERYGYGKHSFVDNQHALMLMKVKELNHEIKLMNRRLTADEGKLSQRDSSFCFETAMDLRENLTSFTTVLHKELYLHIIHTNQRNERMEAM